MGKLDEGSSGAMQGATIGSYFGPVGAFAGAVIGGIFGSSAKRKRRKQEAKILKANTNQAYGIGQQNYSSFSQGRQNIGNEYARNMGADFAKYASSGKELTDDARNQITGRNAQIRDASLEGIQVEEDKYKGSEAYKFFKKDYDYMSGVNAVEDQSDSDVGSPTTYNIRTEGRSGESFFTDKQKGMLRSYTDPDDYQRSNNTAAFLKYAESITPGIDEYEKGRFGSDEDKAAFESAMTDRITAANSVYDDRLALTEADNLRRQSLWQGGD